jgi:hypothetical protein
VNHEILEEHEKSFVVAEALLKNISCISCVSWFPNLPSVFVPLLFKNPPPVAHWLTGGTATQKAASDLLNL